VFLALAFLYSFPPPIFLPFLVPSRVPIRQAALQVVKRPEVQMMLCLAMKHQALETIWRNVAL
jgi:hypothetical protein